MIVRLAPSQVNDSEWTRLTCFAWKDLNHIKNSRAKNDWHMLCQEWHQITSNGITRSANFLHINKLLSIGEWKVLLLPSHFVDYLLPQIQRTLDKADMVSFLSLRLLRVKNPSLCYCSIAMTSPVGFSTGEFAAKQVRKVLLKGPTEARKKI